MEFLTNDKLVIVGAGGMIGSNMVQSALMLGLTPNICLYDIFEPGVHGVFDEIQQCAFPGVNVTYTVNPEEAFTGAKYIISSGDTGIFSPLLYRLSYRGKYDPDRARTDDPQRDRLVL